MIMMTTRRDAQGGFALVFTMGAVALITAVSLGGYVLASQTLHESVKGMELNQSYQLASAGLEQELSFFSLDRIDQYPKTVTRDGGTYVARVVPVAGSTGVYELSVVGTVGDKSEEVLTRFQYLNLWDMNISGGAESSIGVRNGFNGNSTIIGSLYVNGDMEWGSNSDMYGGPVFIKDGEWTAKGSAGVGTSTNRVDAYGPVPTGGNYYTNLKGSAPDLTIPTISSANMAQYEADADVVYPGDLTLGTPFGTPGTDPIAVDGAGVLWIRDGAVIYVKGTVTFATNISGYKGAGTIVSEDGFIVQGEIRPLNGLTETLYGNALPKMDAGNCLGLMSPGDLTSTKDSDWVVAAVFLNGNYNVPNNAHNSFRGSMIVNSINIQTTGTLLCNQPGLGDIVPNGMPGLSGFTARGDWVRR
ncbi:MAG: hypothetical protein U1E26_05730 [Coriobacteriia bacterium]|nr:hypothetical protein [Coriobacteriia bacterium]